MLSYYRYSLYKSIPQLAVAIVIGFMMFPSFLTEIGGWFAGGYTIVDVEFIAVYMFLQAFAFTYLEFSPFRNKRNLDTWFSFPLSREKIAVVKMLNVFTLYGIQTVLYSIVGSILILSANKLNLLPFFGIMFVIWGIAFLIFCFVSVCFLFGNSVFDGAVSVAGWLTVPSAILVGIRIIREYLELPSSIYSYEVYDKRLNLGIFSPFLKILRRLQYFINEAVMKNYFKDYGSENYYMNSSYGKNLLHTNVWIAFAIWMTIFVVCLFVLPKLFAKRPAEKIGGVSDFALSYDFLIPFYSLFLIIATQEIFVIRIFTIPAAYIAYAIYRKSPRITRNRFIVLGVLAFIAFIPFLYLLGYSDSIFGY